MSNNDPLEGLDDIIEDAKRVKIEYINPPACPDCGEILEVSAKGLKLSTIREVYKCPECTYSFDPRENKEVTND